MSEILKVLNKKVELKSERVELGLVQDIKKTDSEIDSSSKKVFSVIKDMASGRKKIESLLSEVDKVKSLLSRWESIYGELKNSSADANDLMTKAISKSKELGVDFTKIEGIMTLGGKEIEATKLLKKLKSEATETEKIINRF